MKTEKEMRRIRLERKKRTKPVPEKPKRKKPYDRTENKKW